MATVSHIKEMESENSSESATIDVLLKKLFDSRTSSKSQWILRNPLTINSYAEIVKRLKRKHPINLLETRGRGGDINLGAIKVEDRRSSFREATVSVGKTRVTPRLTPCIQDPRPFAGNMSYDVALRDSTTLVPEPYTDILLRLCLVSLSFTFSLWPPFKRFPAARKMLPFANIREVPICQRLRMN
uniref:Uncharacterized protein n=1 Tax=Vespula pensylvanica TaxID=30213 RepID=A0A834PF83_VESPE|nr:hypothetical protein H0235_001043 [Vespula pensylvanica]